MMTFVLSSDLILSMSWLSNRHLGKQRVEALQIINTILYGGGWSNHPAVNAWRDHLSGLQYYYNCCLTEWCNRGFKNTMKLIDLDDYTLPDWVYWDDIHYSHQAMLCRKDQFYQFDVPEYYLNKGYMWPGNNTFADIPANLISPRYCGKKIKSGNRKNHSCGVLLKIDQTYCKQHSKSC